VCTRKHSLRLLWKTTDKKGEPKSVPLVRAFQYYLPLYFASNSKVINSDSKTKKFRRLPPEFCTRRVIGIPGKVVEVNLEYNFPTVEAALQRMRNSLTTAKGQGYKAVVLIHGYGSSGVGGSIKTAVRKSLGDSSLRGIVREVTAGEDWPVKKREALAFCKDLASYERRISGNEGVTIVILR